MITIRNDYVSIPDFSGQFALDPKSVRRMITDSPLPAIKIGRYTFIDLAAMLADARKSGKKPSEYTRMLCQQSSSWVGRP